MPIIRIDDIFAVLLKRGVDVLNVEMPSAFNPAIPVWLRMEYRVGGRDVGKSIVGAGLKLGLRRRQAALDQRRLDRNRRVLIQRNLLIGGQADGSAVGESDF